MTGQTSAAGERPGMVVRRCGQGRLAGDEEAADPTSAMVLAVVPLLPGPFVGGRR